LKFLEINYHTKSFNSKKFLLRGGKLDILSVNNYTNRLKFMNNLK